MYQFSKLFQYFKINESFYEKNADLCPDQTMWKSLSLRNISWTSENTPERVWKQFNTLQEKLQILRKQTFCQKPLVHVCKAKSNLYVAPSSSSRWVSDYYLNVIIIEIASFKRLNLYSERISYLRPSNIQDSECRMFLFYK